MILSSPHQKSSLPRISANIRGARTRKLIVAAIDAYRFGYLISCQQVSSRNGSPTWKMTKLMSGKLAAAPSMSQVCVCSIGCGPSGTPLCTPIRFTPSSWAFSKMGKAMFGSSIRHGYGDP